ncbi:uncharacterized protein LOC110811990 isoform X2 [Carica papaya]|uniref:uncharacterized protein LOC110811990 isoform X2 n=1 Tax=Carica papaya TaxID=3649 RepID=UPI000B8D0994|nr:uncharacterized protein LOC110811990 isoform X2 [Carica papaya]XP_021894317.1 uncharacterized protein LOC110811990 isoform X2 [Carica papaya]
MIQKSQGLFRSAVEVTDFILYEVYPEKPTPKPRKKKADEGSSSTVPTGEGNDPVRKKVRRPRKNMVDEEQRSTPVRRKVGRARKVVDGEKMTSSVDVQRKEKGKRKRMEEEVDPFVIKLYS